MKEQVRQGMFASAQQHPSFRTSYITPATSSPDAHVSTTEAVNYKDALRDIDRSRIGSTSKGVLIGVLSAFGSTLFVIIILGLIYFLRYTNHGRILLDRIGRPGEFDDEQAFAREEAEALEHMDDLQRAEYMRAKGKASRLIYPRKSY